MTPEAIAWLLSTYTRALARATMRGDGFVSVVATELEREGEHRDLAEGHREVLALTVEALRERPRVHPAD